MKDSKKLNILVVCQYYYPERFQVTDVCEQMVNDGHSVTVLTGLPNYPTGIIPDEYKRGRRRDEIINGVHVIRCFEIGRKKGAFWMSANYMSYCISAAIKTFSLNKEKYDVIFVYETSPVTMAYPAEVYGKRKKIPVYLYCCDIWPEVVKVMIPNEKSLAFRIIKHISTKLYRGTDLISVQSKGFYEYFKEVHNISGDKICYLPQFADSEYLKYDFEPDDKEIVDFVFTGNIGIAQDIGGLLEAVDKIKEIPGFKVHLVGEGSYLEKAKLIVKQKELQNIVYFYGRQPYEDMPKYYKMADVCLATLQAGSVISLTIPSKVQGYMAAGKPIIAALSGFAKSVIEESGSGICVEPGDTDALANAMKEFICNSQKYKECGKNSRNYFVKNFTKDIYMDNLYNQMYQVISDYKMRRKK